MIKIIKKGKRAKKECLECGCIFSFEREDISNTHLMISTDGVNEKYYDKKTINCPQYNSVLDLGSL